MKIALILAALMLAGCTTVHGANCITRADYERLKAAEPPRIKDRLHGKADEDIRIVAGSNIELRAWGSTLLNSLEVCSR
jgi:hypothetical protein